jgi:proteasome lid subunit RPN8/RPN11
VKKKKSEVEVSESLESLLGTESLKEENKSSIIKPVKKENNLNLTDSDIIALGSTPSQSNFQPNDFILKIKEDANSIKDEDLSDTEQRFGMIKIDSIGADGFIQCPPAIKVIPIDHQAFEDLIMVAKAINEIAKDRFGPDAEKLEVYCYLFCENDEMVEDQPAKVSSIYIPYHQVSEASVHVDETGMLDIQRYVRETGKKLLGWAHSHGHFEVFSSQTDDVNHQIILNETKNYLTQDKFQLKYMYSITVVESGENFPVTLTQYPCGHTEQANAQLLISGDTYSDEESRTRYQEIKKILQDRAKIVPPSQNQSLSEVINSLNDELIADFVRQLWKAKNMVIEQIPAEHENEFDIIQQMIEKYDKLLIAGAEESFRAIAQKIIDLMQTTKKGI